MLMCWARDVSGRMLLLAHLLLSFLLQICSAQSMNCTVTRHVRQTLYSVLGFNATGCHHHWTNGSGNVLANHKDTNKPVVVNTVRRLLINGCQELIHYRRDCISEGSPVETSCTTYCGGTGEIKGDNDITRNHWSALAAVGFFFLLLIGLFLNYKLNKSHFSENGSRDALQGREEAEGSP